MRVCVVSFKECWRDECGRWLTDGGFPRQMQALASLFDAMTLVVVGTAPRAGGLPLPPYARVVPLRRPAGTDLHRKLSVAAHLPYYASRIAAEIRGADVVHTPLPGDLPFLGMLMALAGRKRLIARYGGSWSTTAQSTLMNRVTRQFMRSFAGRRNVMLATGVGTAPPAAGVRWIFASAIEQREIDETRPDLSRPLHRPLRLVYAGRLSPEKGLKDLLAAISLLRHSTDMPEVVLAGGGPQAEELRAEAERLGVNTVIRFTGQLDRPALLAELCQADVFVLPSLTEGFCKALLDAMLCGLPVITTPVGANASVVGAPGERGWLVPAADATSLAERIGAVGSDTLDWHALRQRCQAFAIAHTIERWAASIGDICAAQWGIRREQGMLRL
jgi:glycosyltransferase involved in cell wall biosynthesis